MTHKKPKSGDQKGNPKPQKHGAWTLWGMMENRRLIPHDVKARLTWLMEGMARDLGEESLASVPMAVQIRLQRIAFMHLFLSRLEAWGAKGSVDNIDFLSQIREPYCRIAGKLDEALRALPFERVPRDVTPRENAPLKSLRAQFEVKSGPAPFSEGEARQEPGRGQIEAMGATSPNSEKDGQPEEPEP